MQLLNLTKKQVLAFINIKERQPNSNRLETHSVKGKYVYIHVTLTCIKQ
jgi:hypothetical protein